MTEAIAGAFQFHATLLRPNPPCYNPALFTPAVRSKVSQPTQMPHIKSDRLYILAFAVALILVVAGIGFAIGQITRTPPPPSPTPLPTPLPTPTPEPKAGISDYASLFAKMDKNLFPPEQYHTLLTRLTDCLPDLTSEFKAEFSDTTLSEGETTALLHFMASVTVTIANTSNPFRTQTIHQALTTVVLNCPSPQ